MHHLIIHGLMRLIGLTVGKTAKVTMRGIEGRMGWLLMLLPITVVPLLFAFGFLALNDPDPDDRACSVLGFGLAGVFVLASMYFLTFRLVLEDTILRASSLFTADRQIDLREPFSAKYEDADRTLLVRQGKTKIAINWMISGHEEFHEAIVARLCFRGGQDGRGGG